MRLSIIGRRSGKRLERIEGYRSALEGYGCRCLEDAGSYSLGAMDSRDAIAIGSTLLRDPGAHDLGCRHRDRLELRARAAERKGEQRRHELGMLARSARQHGTSEQIHHRYLEANGLASLPPVALCRMVSSGQLR